MSNVERPAKKADVNRSGGRYVLMQTLMFGAGNSMMIPYTIFQSAEKIELYINLPIPGILKITSMITLPARAPGKASTNKVIIGMIALGKICFEKTFHFFKPFARAVKT